jgi:hypothetical protein
MRIDKYNLTIIKRNTHMPYAIIQREHPSLDIVISTGSAENAYRLALEVVELDSRNVHRWDKSIYESNNSSFKVYDGIYIKGDDTDFSVYNKRGIAIWLKEKATRECMTEKFELAYLSDRAISQHCKLGNILYNCIRSSILDKLQQLETHEEKIELLIYVIDDRYYNKNGSDYFGRYETPRSEVKPPYNLFGLP